MRITLTVAEAVALLTAVHPLPAFVQRPRAEGSTLVADVDLGAVEGVSGLARLALAAAGTATVGARYLEFADGAVTFELRTEARGLSAHRLVNLFTDTVQSALAAQGLSRDVVEIRSGTDAPLLTIHVQRAVAERVDGVTVRDVVVHDGVVTVEADAGDVRLR